MSFAPWFRSAGAPGQRQSGEFSAALSVPIASMFPSFRPLNLSGLHIWLDASDASTITSASGTVSQWNDKSGNGINFAQATAANQPGTGVQTKNGLNVLTFDGSNDRMTGTSSTIIRTIFGVVFVSTTGDYKTILGAKTTDSGPQEAFYFQFEQPTRSPTLALGLTNGSVIRAEQAQVANNAWYLMEGTVDGGPTGADTKTVTMRTNANAITAVTTTAAFKAYSGDLVVGAGFYNRNIVDFFPGRIAEIIAYNRVLTDPERSLVRKYLNAKWQVY